MSQLLYVLTPLTGKEASEKRTIIIGGVELNARLGAVLAVAAAPSLLLTLMTIPFVGVYSLFVFPSLLAAAGFGFYKRSTNGMKLRMYESMRDTYKADDAETFYMCGEEIVLDEHFEVVYSASMPLAPTNINFIESVDSLFNFTEPPAVAVSTDLFAVDEDLFDRVEQERVAAVVPAQDTWEKTAVGGHPVNDTDYSDIFASKRGNRRK